MPFFQLPQAPVNNRRMPFCLSFQSRVTARCTINTYIFILHNFLAFVNCFFIIFVIKFGNKAQEGQTGRLPTRPQAAHGRAALKGGRGRQDVCPHAPSGAWTRRIKGREGQAGRLPTRPRAQHGRCALKGGRGKPLPYMRSILPDRKKSKAGQGIPPFTSFAFFDSFVISRRAATLIPNYELRITN